MIAAKTQNVKALSFVDIEIVQITLQHIVVLNHATMTLIAQQVENAMLNIMNAV